MADEKESEEKTESEGAKDSIDMQCDFILHAGECREQRHKDSIDMQ